MPNSFGFRHGRLELPAHHALVWHVFDNEPWRKETCPVCGKRFTTNPRFNCRGQDIHPACEFSGKHRHHDDWDEK